MYHRAGALIQYIDNIVLLKGKIVNCGNDHIFTTFFVTPRGGLYIFDKAAENQEKNKDPPCHKTQGIASDKHQCQGEQNGGEDSGASQRKAAHRTLQRPQFVGLGCANDVGRSTQRHTLGDRMLQLQQFT